MENADAQHGLNEEQENNGIKAPGSKTRAAMKALLLSSALLLPGCARRPKEVFTAYNQKYSDYSTEYKELRLEADEKGNNENLLRLPGIGPSKNLDMACVRNCLDTMNLDKNWDRIKPALQEYAQILMQGPICLQSDQSGGLIAAYNTKYTPSKRLPFSPFVKLVGAITENNNPQIIWSDGRRMPLSTALLASQDWFDFAIWDSIRCSGSVENAFQDNSMKNIFESCLWVALIGIAGSSYFADKKKWGILEPLRRKRSWGAAISIGAATMFNILPAADADFSYMLHKPGQLSQPHLFRAAMDRIAPLTFKHQWA